MAKAAPVEVIGREEELAALGEFMSSLTADPGGFVLVGEAGCGKTTLWRAGIEAARERGFLVLAASPTEAETRLSFAVLGDLLDGVLDEALNELPEPQRHALEVALLLESPRGAPPDERAVAFAVLSTLRILVQDRPVLVAVDDIQWVDTSSAAVLGFVWRRLRDEPVGRLDARRAEAPVPSPLAGGEPARRLDVSPLSLGALHQLLQTRLGLVLSRPALRRVHEVAGGNAFFALEFGRALAGRGATLAVGEPLPVPGELRELVRDRLIALPSPTRPALAAVAALSQPTIALVSAAGWGEETLAPALEANVLEIEHGRLRFTHPLLASAAYEEVDAVTRRRLHRQLAALVGEEEERARHLALAADGPDPEVAAALDAAAGHARSRGATAAAAELGEQALRLTPPNEQADMHRRMIAAGLYRFDAGDPGQALPLLEGALAAAPTGTARAEALAALSRLHRFEGDQPRGAALARLALAEEGADDRVRAEAAQGLAATLFYLREDLEEAVELAALAAELAARSSDGRLRVESLCLRGLLECLVGRPKAAATVRSAARLAKPLAAGRVLASPAFSRAVLSLWTDGPDTPELLRRSYEDAVELGDEGSAPMVLAQLALAEYLAGRWDEATRVAGEGSDLARQTGQRPMQAYSLSTRALVRASQGLEAETRADVVEALALAAEGGMAAARIHSAWALGLLELSLERPEEAARLFAHQRERLLAAGVGEPGTVRFIPDEVEALVLVGRLEEAQAGLDWLDERAHALRRPSALATAARCSGLLAAAHGQSDAALAHFERALGEHDRVGMPFERARTLLAFGAAQRRAKRNSAARETLGEALALLEEMGATLWAEKARAELARIGGRAPSRHDLTATEERVAALVAQGRTNREVATALFVSDRTVEFHLTHIYRKLGVRSRAELARKLPG